MAEPPDCTPTTAAHPVPNDASNPLLHAPTTALPHTLRRWDLFCRVIDNHGDLGVCLRLGRDLAARGAQVRLWCDDLSALAWMQPTPVPGLQVLPWQEDAGGAMASSAAGAPALAQSSEVTHDTASLSLSEAEPADVVLETFGCNLPQVYLARMAAREVPPVWINLEYLSAEAYVERSHGLQSPQFSGPGAGLSKWFFYPGFTSRTGGLLREPALIDAVQRHDGRAWLAERGWAPGAGERVLSAFAYPHAPWDALLEHLTGPWLLLLCPGSAQQTVPPRLRPGQRSIALPYLSQADYDRLLWSCDLNLVRGEDSFVRAQWAGRPMLWQIYFQDDGAHGPKLQAFLDLAWDGEDAAVRSSWTRLAQAWNGLTSWEGVPEVTAANLDAIGPQSLAWRAKLMRQPDLVTQLMGFALGKAGLSS
ncbi:elongation factor P maturation arginine rhamnosyltransferase EarP [Roseateles depolymerans]|uniref:Protein-arginine rhamnosyltransferase n=1 Tax=Roseateles depolymerans TaxID=76731 RepID=A0A0U3ME47_9BURK|nr:elongation factor P maturation arginine rhamnosyltransferase EarP [Roseateles depolymerans]ALV06585.1 hypothetical protein RD2015_2110 [Roseateles depolymerans]REG19560.1 putative repeat protein (TIGR03837 family) [Roseateles depolymerans]